MEAVTSVVSDFGVWDTVEMSPVTVELSQPRLNEVDITAGVPGRGWTGKASPAFRLGWGFGKAIPDWVLAALSSVRCFLVNRGFGNALSKEGWHRYWHESLTSVKEREETRLRTMLHVLQS